MRGLDLIKHKHLKTIYYNFKKRESKIKFIDNII